MRCAFKDTKILTPVKSTKIGAKNSFLKRDLVIQRKISNKNNGVVCHPRNTELHYSGEQISILFSKRVQ